MYKTQKTFSPLDCKLCNNYDCKYYSNCEQLYGIGFKIAVKDCARLQNRQFAKRR